MRVLLAVISVVVGLMGAAAVAAPAEAFSANYCYTSLGVWGTPGTGGLAVTAAPDNDVQATVNALRTYHNFQTTGWDIQAANWASTYNDLYVRVRFYTYPSVGSPRDYVFRCYNAAFTYHDGRA